MSEKSTPLAPDIWITTPETGTPVGQQFCATGGYSTGYASPYITCEIGGGGEVEAEKYQENGQTYWQRTVSTTNTGELDLVVRLYDQQGGTVVQQRMTTPCVDSLRPNTECIPKSG